MSARRPALPRRRSVGCRHALRGRTAGLILLAGVWAWSRPTAQPRTSTPDPLRRSSDAFVDTWIGPAFVDDVLPSLGRLGVGVVARRSWSASPPALLIGLVPLAARRSLEPVLEFFRAIPPPVLSRCIMLLARHHRHHEDRRHRLRRGLADPAQHDRGRPGHRQVHDRHRRARSGITGWHGCGTSCCPPPARRSWPACARRCRSRSS